MTIQSEFALEQNLIEQLQCMEYARVRIDHEAAMLANLKRQLEIQTTISNLPTPNLIGY